MRFILAGAATVAAATVFAHNDRAPHSHEAATAALPMPLVIEQRGPVKAPARFAGQQPVSGHGYWKFVAVTNAVPVPAEASPRLKGAHGTLIVDAERDVVFWGLKGVGWVGFSNQLRDSWIVRGDEAFTRHNLHGADIQPRKGQLPLVVAADNEGTKVYLSDTTFLTPRTLAAPQTGSYATNRNYAPTDAAFAGPGRIFITDGYAQGYFMAATLVPLAYEGNQFGGHSFSKTPHGITYHPRSKNILVSARPEGQLKRWSIAKERVLEIGALPAGTWLCDVDVWGDYALAACLDAPDKKPGPLMILNLKTRTIASIIKPKEDLGYGFADHIHDACWYVRKAGRTREVYLIFTSWNPGGIGALKLVNLPD
jgi:hypothetical protein